MKLGTLVKGIVAVVVIGLILGGIYMFTMGDFKNKMARKGIEHNNHDYSIVVSLDGGYSETFELKNGKVTTYPTKGYYAFWATVNGDKKYIQAPIRGTLIKQTD